VWTVYEAPGRSAARVYGEVRDVASGETARLYAQPFPFSRAPAPVGPLVALHPAGQAKVAGYSFQVTPDLATRYRVEVFPGRPATTALTSSAITTIYVAGGWRGLQNPVPCGRPVCHETLVGEVLLPPSALSTEMAKPVRPYFGLTLVKSASAPFPTTLQLGGGGVHVTVKQVSAGAYEETLTFTFAVGKTGGYSWLWNACVQDTVTEDGMGLPGHHLCGDQTIPTKYSYLGLS
jgi:hypothetical protein